MSIIRRGTGAPERRTAALFNPQAAVIPPPGEAGYWASESYSMTSDQAMRHAAVYACVRIIADTIGAFPLDAYTGDPGVVAGESKKVDPKPSLLANPSDYLTLTQWVHQIAMSLLLQGNAYGLIAAEDRAGYPTQIELLDPQTVTVRKSDGNDVNTVTGRPIPSGTKLFRIQGKNYTPNEIWHCPGPMLPGELAGLSPVKYASRVISLGNRAEQFGLEFFTNGIHPTAVATTDQPVTEDQAKAIKTRLKQAVAARDIPVLGAGMELKPWQTTPEDSQLIEMQRANEVAVCQVFGVPPEMIGASARGSSITYANREQRAQDFLNNTINPWLTRLEDSLSRLFPRTTTVKFDTKALLKSDLLTRYQAWQIGTGAGFLTADEVRKFEDMPPLPPSAVPAPMGPTDPPPAGAANEGQPQ